MIGSLGVAMYLSRDVNSALLRAVASLAGSSTLVMSFQLPLELVDEAYELAAEAIGARLTFRRVAEGSAGQPARLRVTYPRLRSQRALTAQFNNIPLPTEAFRRAD